MIAPYVDRWPEALAIMGQPSNVAMSLGHLAKIVDEIWYLAGDKSADVSEAVCCHASSKCEPYCMSIYSDELNMAQFCPLLFFLLDELVHKARLAHGCLLYNGTVHDNG